MKIIDQLLILQQYDMRKFELQTKILAAKNKIASIEQQSIVVGNSELKCSEQIKKALFDLNICQNNIKNIQYDIEKFTKANEQSKTILELKSSQSKLDQLQIQLQKLEEQAFELLCKADEAQESFAKTKKENSSNNLNSPAEISQLELSIKDYEDRLVKTDVKIEQLCEDFDKKTLRLYRETVASVKRFPVVVKMIDEKCSGCNLKLSGGNLSELLAVKDAIVQCEHCNRLLYVVSDEELLEDDEVQF